nr:hypothetical protein [Tanacetum cinerariifolium]
METTIEQQVTLDEAFVPSTKRLRSGRSNFRLPSDIQSKESTLQVVYDVLRRSPFFKAFLVTTDGDAEETESDEESVEEETREEEEESFDPIPKTPKDSEDDGNGEEDQGLRVSEEQRLTEEEEADELYRDVDINQGWGLQVSQDIEDSHVTLTPIQPDGQQESSLVSLFVTSMLNPISDAGVESIFMTASSPIAPIQTSTPIMTPSTIAIITTSSEAPIPPTTIPSVVFQNLPTFDSVFRFEDRVKSLEVNFSKFMQTNQFAEAVSKIPGIVHQYMTQQIMKAVREAVQIQTDWLQDSFQRENDEFLRTIDENIKKIIKGQDEVLTRSSHSSRTSYAVAADLTEMELKKILIEKMEGNKEDVGMMMIKNDPLLDQTGGQRDEEKTTCQMDKPSHPVFETGAEDQPIIQTSQHPEWFSQPRKPPTPDRDWNKTLLAIQGSAQTWISKLAKQADSLSYFNELLDTLIDFSNFIMNRLGVDTLTPKLLAGPTYELMRGSCTSLTELEYHLEEVYKETTDQLEWVNPEGQQYPHNLLQPLSLIPDNRGHRVILFAHFINNDLEYLRGGASSHKYTTSVTKTKVTDYGHIKWIEDLVPRTTWIQERKIIAVTELKIMEWHNYKYLDWISVRRDDDKIYKFKEGNFKRLRLQDIEDMLLLLVQGKLSNLTVEERFALNASLRMFTRSIVIQRRVEDLQLGDKKNRLIRIDELYKFSDGTLNDVRNALDDRLKGIRMQYLPQTIWRKGDKDRAAAMIQSIDKMLKTRRIMRSLERSILTDLQETLKRRWRYLVPAESYIHNCMLIPNYQDIKYQDFCYSDELSNLERHNTLSWLHYHVLFYEFLYWCDKLGCNSEMRCGPVLFLLTTISLIGRMSPKSFIMRADTSDTVATGPGNVVVRRVTDDLITFSGETAVLKYMKIFLVQKDQDEVHDSLLAAKDVKRGEESKLLALHEVIAEALEEIESQGNNVEMLDAYVALYSEEFNLLCCAQFYNLGSSMPRLCPYGDRVLEMTKLCYVCDCYTDHELFNLMQECVVLEMYDLVYGWQINSCRIWFLTMAALYILDKLSEVGNSSRLEDKMKVVFSRAKY